MAQDRADKAVRGIIKDLAGRCGIGDEWGSIGPDEQRAIREKWAAVVRRHLKAEREAYYDAHAPRQEER